MKNRVAFCMAIFLILLSGICFSDEFEFLQRVAGQAQPTFEKAYDAPPDQEVYLSDELPGMPSDTAQIAFATVSTLAGSLQTRPPLLSLPSASDRSGPSGGPKIFQFLSTYRI